MGKKSTRILSAIIISMVALEIIGIQYHKSELDERDLIVSQLSQKNKILTEKSDRLLSDYNLETGKNLVLTKGLSDEKEISSMLKLDGDGYKLKITELTKEVKKHRDKAKLVSNKDKVKSTSRGNSENSNYLNWKKVNVQATGYSDIGDSGCKPCHTTATGSKPRVGIIAVDPSVIPLGSKVYIPEFGVVFTAEDTGGRIKGNIIDIFFDHGDKARNWGRKNIQVYVQPK